MILIKDSEYYVFSRLYCERTDCGPVHNCLSVANLLVLKTETEAYEIRCSLCPPVCPSLITSEPTSNKPTTNIHQFVSVKKTRVLRQQLHVYKIFSFKRLIIIEGHASEQVSMLVVRLYYTV
jgi:hypothetical protein